MADYVTEQNFALAQKMLEQQGEIDALKADRDALQKRLDWNIDQADQWFQAFREAEMERNRLRAQMGAGAELIDEMRQAEADRDAANATITRELREVLSVPFGPAEPLSPVSAATEVHGGAGEAQEGSR